MNKVSNLKKSDVWKKFYQNNFTNGPYDDYALMSSNSGSSSSQYLNIVWSNLNHVLVTNSPSGVSTTPNFHEMRLNQRDYSVGGDIRLRGNTRIHSERGPVLKVSHNGKALEIEKGQPLDILMPDRSRILIDAQGNFEILDEDAKVTYQAHRNRNFNPYVNAGDMVATFIDYLRTIPGVYREDVSTLPIQLFVHWLIIEAAKRDHDPVPEDVEDPREARLLKGRILPQCELPTCRRFIKKTLARSGFRYCNPDHAEEHHHFLQAA